MAFRARKKSGLSRNGPQAPVVQKMDSAIRRINRYPLDSAIGFAITYPLDSNESVGEHYPSFEQLEPERFCKHHFQLGLGLLERDYARPHNTKNSIDRFRNWRSFDYSFVFVLMRPTSFAVKQHFFCILSMQTRQVGLRTSFNRVS